ncbi:DNA repair protein RecO C-terminal domain-containing protein [Bacillus paranthracis]
MCDLSSRNRFCRLPLLGRAVFCASRHAEQDQYRIPVGEAVHKLLRLFYHFDLHRLGNVSVKDSTKKQMRLVLNTYYDEYCGIYLKSRRFLEQLDKFQI